MRHVAWDIVLTILLLVATLAILLVSALFDLFAVAFTDDCPEACHADAGVAVVFTVWICSVGVALIGIVVSIISLLGLRHNRQLLTIPARE